jgi:hypothetical protein
MKKDSHRQVTFVETEARKTPKILKGHQRGKKDPLIRSGSMVREGVRVVEINIGDVVWVGPDKIENVRDQDEYGTKNGITGKENDSGAF